MCLYIREGKNRTCQTGKTQDPGSRTRTEIRSISMYQINTPTTEYPKPHVNVSNVNVFLSVLSDEIEFCALHSGHDVQYVL